MENKSENNIPNQNQEIAAIDACEELKKSIEAIVLYRSLYILKKKFELNKQKIKLVYNSFNLDKTSNVDQYKSYQISIENFVVVAEAIFKECNIILTTLNDAKDIFLSSIFLNLGQKLLEMNAILNEIKMYITDENNSLVKKYNSLFFDKKIKPHIIKDILDNKRNIKKKNLNLENNEMINDENADNGNQNNEKEKENELNQVLENNKNEDEEISKKIVEYDRKGNIVKTYDRLMNDNLTLSMEKENYLMEMKKKEREIGNIDDKKFQYFDLNEMNNNINEMNENEDFYNNNNNESKNYLLDIENGINFNNILYIETLPLIIADYMQQFPFYCIIETESDLSNELNVLFDRELIEKMNSYEEAQKSKNEIFLNKDFLRNVLNKNKIENNIKIYENLISEKREKGENTVFLENMLEKLIAENIVIEDKISKMKKENNFSHNLNKLNQINEYQDNINNNIINNIELNDTSKYSNISVLAKQTESNNNNKSKTNKSLFNKININEYNSGKIRIGDIGKSKLTTISQSSTNIKFGKNTMSKKTYKKDSQTRAIISIKEIFNFYSRQHNSVGSNGLFSDVEKNMEHLTLSEFYRFCVEFNIPITRQKSSDIYKKSISVTESTYNKSYLMNFEEFIISLKLIANNINQGKMDLLQKNIQQEKNKLNQLEMKQEKLKEMEKYNKSINLNRSNHINNNKNSFDKAEFYFQCEKTKLVNSIFSLETKYNNEKNKNENDIINNFLSYLGVNSTNDYKSKLKGFLLPFRTREKQKSMTRSKNGIGSPLELEIKEANKVYTMQKIEQKKLMLSKEVVQKQLLFNQRKKLFKLNNDKLFKDIQKKINRKYSDKLSDFKNEKERKKKEFMENKKKEEYEKKNLISWNKLENFDVKNLEINDDEKELFNESENSDEEILDRITHAHNNNNNNNKVHFSKKLIKNNSAVELVPKKKILLPPITQKINMENNYYRNDRNNNMELKDNSSENEKEKKQESNIFGNLSVITNNNQSYSVYE